MRRIRKDDEVIVISGKDKGRRGKVARVLEDGERLIVAGGIVEREAAIHVSNVMLFNPVAKKGDRVGFRVLEDGRKVRYFKSDNEVVDV